VEIPFPDSEAGAARRQLELLVTLAQKSQQLSNVRRVCFRGHPYTASIPERFPSAPLRAVRRESNKSLRIEATTTRTPISGSCLNHSKRLQ